MGQGVAPTSLFQLDGNAANSGLTTCSYAGTTDTACDYWDQVNGIVAAGGPNVSINQPPPGNNTVGHWAARTFANGLTNIDNFTGGGSKDPNPLSQWRYTSTSTPNKDTLNGGYAAGYIAPGGHFVLEFGADRAAPNGDANIGIWFFQSTVATDGAGGFTGAHNDHDIFVISAFTTGGGVSTITIYEWNSGCAAGVKNPVPGPLPGSCADTNIRLIAAPTSVCGTAIYCAVTNAAATTITWEGGTSLASPLFFEGGMDVTQTLLNLGVTQVPCFSSFLEETRSSQSTTAVLKDFLLGSFKLCSVSITKACSGTGTLAAGGTTIDYLFTGTVTDTGIGGLSHVTVVDSLPPGAGTPTFKKGATLGTISTTVTSGACPVTGFPAGAVCADLGSLAAGQVEYWSVEFDVAATSAQNTASARGSSSSSPPGACTASGTVCTTQDGLASCSASPTNSITISKVCGVPTATPAVPGTQLISMSGLAAVQVNFSGVIDNTGDTPLTGITVTDNPSTTVTVTWPDPTKPGTLPAGSTATYTGSYIPTGTAIIGDGTTAGRYHFNDDIKVTKATATLGSSPGHDTSCITTFENDAQACHMASCNICPGTPTGLCGGN
jgi:hypothetical protein